MKLGQMKFVSILATLTIATTTATPIPLKDPIASMSEGDDEPNDAKRITRGEQAIGTCLRIAPNLPPCNFDSEATWRSGSGEILHADHAAGRVRAVVESPDFLTDTGSGQEILIAEESSDREDAAAISTGEKRPKEFHLCGKKLATTVVYYLEGCLPARLPFDLPSCPIDELQTIQMNKLIPFQLPGVQDALIFPEIDVKQIEFSHRQSQAAARAPLSSSLDSQSHEESNADNGGSIEETRVRDGGSNSANGLTAPAGDARYFPKMTPESIADARTGTASEEYVGMPRGSAGVFLPGYLRRETERTD